jgi:hypothetical protein
MHSDGAAIAALSSADRHDALDRRVAAACAAPRPAQALHALARELRDKGLEQRVLYDLFDSCRARHTDDEDDDEAFDGLCDTMDFICGWHSPGHPMALFPEALPQAQSRTREWQEVQAEAGCDAAEPDGPSRLLVYTAVAGFVAAVFCVHCTVAIVLTAAASKDYAPVAWVALLWALVMTIAFLTARLSGSKNPAIGEVAGNSAPAAEAVPDEAACTPAAAHETAARRRVPASEAAELW